jgi:hypothetical protein
MRVRIGPLSGFPLRYLRAMRKGPPDPSLSKNRRAICLLRCAVLASSILLMLPGAWSNSATVVEFAQLPSGLAAWQRHSLAIYRVCGPVSKFLYSLPAYLAGVRVEYPASFDADIQSRREWEVGRLFQSQNRERYHDIYRWSRLLPILVTVIGGCLICEWSSRLFGTSGGIVSLCMWCWMPPVLAHGSLVTSDMLSAVMILLAARAFWAFLLSPNLLKAILAGLALGLASATKFTLLILYPCWAGLLLTRAFRLRGRPKTGPHEEFIRPRRIVTLGLVVLVTSIVAIDALYEFKEVGFPLARWQPALSSLAQDVHRLGEGRQTGWLLEIVMPLPLELFRGVDSQLADTERNQSAYLLGRRQRGGWWYWYAVAALIKLPLPTFALFGLALPRLKTLRCDRHLILWANLCLLLPAAEAVLVIAATTGSGTNAAFRYLLPTLPLLCVWIGRAWDNGSRITRWVIITLLGWLAVNAVNSLPDHLGWQNELGWTWSRWSGQPALVGDNLDWGQDLARLAAWVSQHCGDGNTLVCAHGMGDAEPYGLRAPTALPASGQWGCATYLAVSLDILLSNDPYGCVDVEGRPSSINRDLRATLLHLQPFEQVGRTIRVYRLRDVVPDLAVPRSE